jgi:aryl-alcohol dehydrogenase-like predicted oxidoreductase
VFDTFQIPYSALERDHEEWITQSRQSDIGTIIRGGVARGEPGEGLGNADRWAKFDEAELDELCEPGESRSAFMLRFTLSHPYIDTIIAGTLQPEHLAENVAAVLRGPLSPEVYAQAKRRLERAGVSPAE